MEICCQLLPILSRNMIHFSKQINAYLINVVYTDDRIHVFLKQNLDCDCQIQLRPSGALRRMHFVPPPPPDQSHFTFL